MCYNYENNIKPGTIFQIFPQYDIRFFDEDDKPGVVKDNIRPTNKILTLLKKITITF